ncbi:hypothetical protein ACFPIF_09445 [Brevundimonas faecalis]|uniref:hypothetical protein n=1 Tax=Brevundimonas faecalis TaxID=947378 RepID=UPI00360A170C
MILFAMPRLFPRIRIMAQRTTREQRPAQVSFLSCDDANQGEQGEKAADIDSEAYAGHKPALLASGFGPRRDVHNGRCVDRR